MLKIGETKEYLLVQLAIDSSCKACQFVIYNMWMTCYENCF